jgi:hypothetical protein
MFLSMPETRLKPLMPDRYVLKWRHYLYERTILKIITLLLNYYLRSICMCSSVFYFDGGDSDRRIFLISVEQLRMNTNILSVKLYLASIVLTLFHHYTCTNAVLWSTMENKRLLWTDFDISSTFVLLFYENLHNIFLRNTTLSLDDK